MPSPKSSNSLGAESLSPLERMKQSLERMKQSLERKEAAEQEKSRAEQEKSRAEQEKSRAEQEKAQAIKRADFYGERALANLKLASQAREKMHEFVNKVEYGSRGR